MKRNGRFIRLNVVENVDAWRCATIHLNVTDDLCLEYMCIVIYAILDVLYV